MSLGESVLGLLVNGNTVGLLIVSLLKITLLLGLALFVRALMPKSHPDRRHLLLRVTLVVTLLLPLLIPVLPPLGLRIFDTLPGAAMVTSASVEAAPGSHGVTSVVGSYGHWPGYLIPLWIAGVFAVLFHLVYGLMLRSRILRRSRPLESEEYQSLTFRLCERLHLRRPVRLAISSSVSGPIAWSFPHPTVILNADAVNWKPGEVRLALTHELGHIRRRDDVWMLVSSLVVAFHWFNPLAWLARERLILDADHACDGYVVNSGADSTDYASFMLAVARQCSTIKMPMVTGAEIFSRKQLEERIMTIQNEVVRSVRVRRSLVRFAWVLALAISIPVAAARLAGSSDSPDTAKHEPGVQAEQYPAPDSFVRMDEAPEPVSMPNPIYPDSANKVGLEGSVWVQVLVSKDGHAIDARIRKTSGHDCFDRSALEAARKTVWKPAMEKGKPVAVWASYEIKFQLQKGAKAKDK